MRETTYLVLGRPAIERTSRELPARLAHCRPPEEIARDATLSVRARCLFRLLWDITVRGAEIADVKSGDLAGFLGLTVNELFNCLGELSRRRMVVFWCEKSGDGRLTDRVRMLWRPAVAHADPFVRLTELKELFLKLVRSGECAIDREGFGAIIQQLSPRSGPTARTTVETILDLAEEGWLDLVEIRVRHRPISLEERCARADWKRIRDQMLERAGHACSLCDKTADNSILDVHHRHYRRHGFELLADLIVLCRECHDRHHAKLPAGPDDLTEFPAPSPPDGPKSSSRRPRHD